MNQSSTIAKIASALSKFQAAITSVKKTETNPFFKARYAGLDTIWEMVRKPLTDNGLSLIQTTSEEGGDITLATTLLHESGEYISGVYPITPMRQVQGQGWTPSNDPQSIGSALTYARRYAMSALLGISSEEDDDGEQAMNRGKPQGRQPQGTGTTAPQPTQERPQDTRTAPPEEEQVDQGIPASAAALLTRATNELGYTGRAAIFQVLEVSTILAVKDLSAAWEKLILNAPKKETR